MRGLRMSRLGEGGWGFGGLNNFEEGGERMVWFGCLMVSSERTERGRNGAGKTLSGVFEWRRPLDGS